MTKQITNNNVCTANTSCTLQGHTTAAGMNDLLNIFVLRSGRLYLRPDDSSLVSPRNGWHRSAEADLAFLLAILLQMSATQLFVPRMTKHCVSKHRADVSHQDMEEINSLQSIQDLERFLSFFPPVVPLTDTHMPCSRTMSCLSSSVTVFYAECLESTSPMRERPYCWSSTCRLCFFAESTRSKVSKPQLSCR